MGRDSKLVSNPAVKTLQWKNEKKSKGKVVRETGWYFWDKNANDGEGANVMVDMPFTFMWLETATSFSGFNDKLEKGIYSNEVLDIKTQPLIVRCNNETLGEGLYNNIKDAMKDLDKDFQVFKNVTVSKYTPEDIYAFKDKKDPYNYSVLDSLDKIIKSEKKK